MENHQELIRIALQSKRISNVLEDYELLASLCSCVSPQSNEPIIQDNVFGFVKTAYCTIQDLLSVGAKCETIWTVREGVDWLLFYLFYRRYGWDDWINSPTPVQVFAPSTEQRVRTASKEEELRFKDRILTVSSCLINWFEKSPLFLASLKMMNSALRIARCSLNTRQHMVAHAVRWLISKLGDSSKPGGNRRLSLMPVRTSNVPSSPILPEDATPETMYMAVKDLIVICMTDPAFTIRSSIIPSVAKLLDQLSLNTIVRLLEHMIEVCSSHDEESWETTEGLLNALGLLIKRAIPFTGNGNAKQDNASTGVAAPTTGAPTTMSPETYLSQIHTRLQVLVFHLFDHHHPSVRIGAVNLFITCLKRCPQSVIDKALDEIMSEICVTTEMDPVSLDEEEGPSLGVHAAESLLSLCQVLLQYSGDVRLPPATGRLQNSLINTYMGHPNANVRMAACQVYVTLILSAIENQNRVRYLLKKIIDNWSIRQDILLSPLQKSPSSLNGAKAIGPNPTTINPGPLAYTREARLKIFALVSHVFVQRHYAVLYSVLVRGVQTPFDSDPPSGDDANNLDVAPRTQRNFSLKPGMLMLGRGGFLESPGRMEARRSLLLDEPLIQYSRSGSSGSTSDVFSPSSPKPIGSSSSSFLPVKKPNVVVMSTLDRFRMTDEAEKSKKMEQNRTSVWKSELTRRFSMVGRNSTVRNESISGSADSGQTKLRQLLTSMLHASCENLVAEPRELRQCARKTFPEVLRLFFWFDADTAAEFIYSNLISPPTLMTYAALKALRASLDEFSQYEKLVISGEDYVPPDITSISLSEAKCRNNQYLDTLPDGYFLNVPMIKQIFHPERSSVWLRFCNTYLTTEEVPTFIWLPAFDCVIVTLSLVHRFPEFIHAARYTEMMKPTSVSPTDKSEAIHLTVDPNCLIEAVRSAVSYLTRFEVKLNKRLKPVTVSGEHQKVSSLRPFPLPLVDEPNKSAAKRPIKTKLVAFLTRLVHSLEKVLFNFLPPSGHSTKPGPILRRTSGALFAPCLGQLATWPLGLLPPGQTDPSVVGVCQHELRVLAVRKLLRVIASIVHALPASNVSPSKESDPDTGVPAQMETIVIGRVDVTSTANAYFTQLEKICIQLTDASSPLPLSESASWWWFRALCEHIPKIMQIAPHANPVSLLRHLLDEVYALSGHAPKGLSTSKENTRLWKRAISYAKEEVAKGQSTVKPNANKSAGYTWATVGELAKGEVKEGPMETAVAPSPVKPRTVEFCEVENVDKRDSSLNEALLTNSENPAFDYMADESEQLLLEAAEPDSSSDEELALTVKRDRKKRASVVQLSKRRKRYSSSQLKPQPLETPSPLPDIVSLVKRVWANCEPVTVRTLQNLLNESELSLITGEQEELHPQQQQLDRNRLSILRT